MDDAALEQWIKDNWETPEIENCEVRYFDSENLIIIDFQSHPEPCTTIAAKIATLMPELIVKFLYHNLYQAPVAYQEFDQGNLIPEALFPPNNSNLS